MERSVEIHVYKYQTPKGAQRWRVVVQDEGRRLSKAGLLTERDAKRAGAQLSIQLGKQPDPTQATVEDLLDLWLGSKTFAITLDTDYRALLRRLPGWLKAWKVENVTTMMVDQAYRRLLADGFTPHRVRRVHEMLFPAFELALTWDWIRTNPARAATQPARPEVDMTVPDPADVLRIIDAGTNVTPELGCALELAAFTGMRRGELCALQWSDLTDSHIHIRRSVSTTTADPHRVTTGKTGKKGWRKVPLGPTVLRSLKAHRARQNTFMLERGISGGKWIFTHDGARPWRTDYLTKAFTRIRDDLDVDVHLHQFRHFAATQWIASGMDIVTVAHLLGHAKTSTTLDLYAAYLPARGIEAAGHMEHVLRRTAT